MCFVCWQERDCDGAKGQKPQNEAEVGHCSKPIFEVFLGVQ
jgi:hypothetical protein